ncbi:MAG: NAD(+) diphosphatase [Pseudomonadota bacterium]
MWPQDPDGFVSLVKPPEGSDPDRASYFLFRGRERVEIIGVNEGGAPRPLNDGEFRWLDMDIGARLYMGEYHGGPAYAVEVDGAVAEGQAAVDLRGWLGRVSPELFYLAGRAQQTVAWHREHRFCGRCGAEMNDHEVDRAKQCPKCGLISYPRLSPSIIVLITRGEEMLLARNAAWPNGMFSTLAGFVEPGESIEQTVHREIKEEVGLDVTNLRYQGSQSWPFPNSLMLGFRCEYAGGEIVCQEGEIAEANFFAKDALPNMPPKTAISRWLIDDFLAELGG